MKLRKIDFILAFLFFLNLGMRNPSFPMTFKNIIAACIGSAVLATLVGFFTNALIKRRK